MHQEQDKLVPQRNSRVFGSSQALHVEVFKLSRREGNGIVIGSCQRRSALDAAGSLDSIVDRLVFDVSEEIVLVAPKPSGILDALLMSSGCPQGIKRLAQAFVREPIGEISQIADVSMYRAITGRYPIKARGVQSIFTDCAAVEPSNKGRE